MEQTQLQRAIEAILFAAGERVEVARLAMALEADPARIVEETDRLAETLAFERRGIRILKLEVGYQMVSSGEMADFVTKALETRKPPKLSFKTSARGQGAVRCPIPLLWCRPSLT